jgi:hypothetical protein
VSRCLGARIADLADGRLPAAEAERAYAHVAVCPDCRAALEAQRAARRRLGSAEQPSVAPPSDLFDRLLGIAEGAPAIPVQGGAGVRPGGAAGAHPASARVRSRRVRRGRVVIAGAAGVVAVAAAVAVGVPNAVSGIVTSRPPSVAPVVDTFTDEHAVTADQVPFTGPRIVTVGYTIPDATTPGGSPTPEP